MIGEKVFLDLSYDLTVNTLGDLERHTCNSEMNHNYDKTLYEKIAKDNEELFNCSVPFHPSIRSQITGRTIEICDNPETGKKAYYNWEASLSAGSETPINKPCAAMDIYLGIPFIDNDQSDDEAFIRVYIKSDMKIKSIILYYDLTTLVAEIGGLVGMFLGISLVDLTIMCNSALFKIVTI